MRIALALILMTACNDAADDSLFEAGHADAAQDVDKSACTVSIADYCDVKPCPSDEDAALAELCASDGIVAECGNVVETIGIDFGTGYVFDDGGLATIFSYNNAKVTCLAGTLGSNVANIGCSFMTNACTTDAGDASDQ